MFILYSFGKSGCEEIGDRIQDYSNVQMSVFSLNKGWNPIWKNTACDKQIKTLQNRPVSISIFSPSESHEIFTVHCVFQQQKEN